MIKYKLMIYLFRYHHCHDVMDGVSDNKISKAWKCNITSRNEQISLIEYIISEDIAIDLDDMRMGWQFFQKILIIPVNHILKIYRDLAEKLRKIWNLGPASYLASAHKDSSEGASANKKKVTHGWGWKGISATSQC